MSTVAKPGPVEDHRREQRVPDPGRAERARTPAGCSVRKLYYYLLNIDEYPELLPAARGLALRGLAEAVAEGSRVPGVFELFAYSPTEFDARIAAIAEHVRTQREAAPEPGLKACETTAGISPSGRSGIQTAQRGYRDARQEYSQALTRDQYRYLVRQHAPAGLIDGCWLQNIAKAATAHDEVPAQLFGQYAYKLGEGRPAASHAKLFAQLLGELSIDLPEVSCRLFAEQPEILDSAFTVPVFSLAVSQFPREFLPEIIGLNLAFFLGISEYYGLVVGKSPGGVGIRSRYFVLNGSCDPGNEQVRKAIGVVHAYLSDGRAGTHGVRLDERWRRVWSGFLAVPVLERDLIGQIRDSVDLLPQRSASEAVLSIIRAKLPYAVGHHRDRPLGDRRLEDWFRDETFDGPGFLDALAGSAWVDQEQPEKSRLLTEILAFGGPMYKVFTPLEEQAILNWIRSLKDHGHDRFPARHAARVGPSKPLLHVEPARGGHGSGARGSAPMFATGRRFHKDRYSDLYHRLINIDRFPDVLPLAKAVASTWLDRAHAALRRGRVPDALRYFPYTHEAFDERIASIYGDAVRSYRPFVPPPRFDKAEYLWFLAQLAPTVLVDGCWLQNIAKVGGLHAEISQRLFRIYADEIGSGDVHKNHPNVYRRLMKSQGMEIPDVGSYAFIRQSLFTDAVFTVPVFLLAISQFPRTFFPEIIGLNLYIELSGLGAVYMSLVDELSYWGIDPSIVALHLSIDNLSSGHAAIAREAVELHLDQIQAIGGRSEMLAHWRRVWAGYVSLTIVAKPLWKDLLLRYLLKFGVKRVCRMLGGGRVP